MILVNHDTDELILPKVDRCKLNTYDESYQLILQHKATRKLFVYCVKDHGRNNPVYFHFHFSVAEDMEYGEYNLYLIAANHWSKEEIDRVDPKATLRVPDKTPVLINGRFITSGNELLMSRTTKAIIEDAYSCLTADGDHYVANLTSCDERIYGDLEEPIEILYTDILKYRDHDFDPGIGPGRLRDQKHTEYKR
ncbi:MAG: hypothetical protein LIP08_07925 [Bacteroides sp.]|nr:hypothetical protein [Bacteroides sp.]